MAATIRRIVTIEDEILAEAGRKLPKPIRRVAVAAVIANPFAGRAVEDLEPLIAIGEELGGLLGRRALDALGGDPALVESFGKGAIVGGAGELEHAAALLHPKLGAPLRAALGGGIALIPSAKKIGAIGAAIDVPLGHKDAAKVRSHFDAMTVSVPDAPRDDEIVVALVLTDGGRPWPRVGGLTVDQVQGRDGLI
jgi:hypothetical protein